MHTPTSAQGQSSRSSSLQVMLMELDRKIGQISDLKGQITERIFLQEIEESAKKDLFTKRKHYCQKQLYQQISELSKYSKNQFRQQICNAIEFCQRQNFQSALQIAKFYEGQSRKMIQYYEMEIRDSREEIKRQYKVIAMMKQEVEDLMVLMKYKDGQILNTSFQNREEDSSNFEDQRTQQNQNEQKKYNRNQNKMRLSGLNERLFNSDLDVIEEQTQRTLQSSERSCGNQFDPSQKNSHHIRVEEPESDEGSSHKKNSIAEDYRKEMKKMKESGYKSQNNLRIPENITQFVNHQDSYADYCESLTPKQTEKLDNLVEIQRSLSIADYYVHPNVMTNVQTSEQEYELDNQNEEYTKTEGSIVKNIRNNNVHTNPSGNRKPEHLQSIFFLDEEHDHFNKTTANLNQINNYDFEEGREHKSEHKSLHQSHVLKSQENQVYFFTENNQHQNNQIKQFNIFKRRDNYNDYCSEKNMTNCQDILVYPRMSENRIKKSQSETNQSYKMIKKNQKYVENEISQEVFHRFNNMLPSEFQNLNSSLTSNEPLRQLSPNLASQKSIKNSSNKPKTKQFLQEFRKNFSKCLQQQKVQRKSSSKSSSSKSNTKSTIKGNEGIKNLLSGVMTFGKNNIRDKQNVFQKKIEFEDINKDNSKKAVDHMLRDLQNSNKFLIGCKKMQTRYEGQKDKKSGLRNGNGILYYSNGLCYEGSFKDGNRHGYGVLRMNCVDVYNGDWANDQIEGQGRIKNCSIINKKKNIQAGPLGKWISYTGELKNSKFEGSGTLMLQAGEKFVGNFRNGIVTGQGSLYRKNGQVQHGIWQNGVLIQKQYAQ